MATIYTQSSPYKQTKIFDNALDILAYRNITKEPDDVRFRINDIYALRPDKLAFDLYGNSELWWVFANRNPNVIEDPVFDFRVGTVIFLPKQATLENDLGI